MEKLLSFLTGCLEETWFPADEERELLEVLILALVVPVDAEVEPSVLVSTFFFRL